MKKGFKAFALVAAAGTLIAGSSFAVMAAQTGTGEWRTDSTGTWYALTADGSEYANSGWYNIQGEDGVISSYYFDASGYLAVDTEVEGYTVDSEGRYTVDGEAKTYEADAVDYTVAGTLASGESEELEEAVVTDEAASDSEVTTADLLGLTSDTTTSTFSGIVSGGAYSSEDDPANASSTIDFTRSSISGTTATNNWSGFRMVLPGTPTAGADDNTDWYYEEEDVGVIISSYYPLSKFDASNLDEFISAFTATARGFAPSLKSGTITNAGTTSCGGIQFTKLTRQDPSPESTSYKDYCYLRMVNGLVHVLIIDYYGSGEQWESITMNNIYAV